MSSPAAETNEPAAMAAEQTASAEQPTLAEQTVPGEPQALPAPAAAPRAPWTAARLASIVVPVALVVLGVAILASNLGLLAPGAERVVQVLWPAGLVLAGLWLIAAGDRLWTASPVHFSVERGEAQQAALLASAGTADMGITGGAGADELASGETTMRGGPKVEMGDGHTTLRLEPGWGVPALGGVRWTLALAPGVPWQINLQSSTGDLELDLTDLAVAELRLRSMLGDVTLKLPVAGGTELDLGLAFGDLTVSVPEGVGVRIKLRQGALADVEHDDRRFIRLAPDEVGTPLYAVAARRCTLTVWLGTGSLLLQ